MRTGPENLTEAIKSRRCTREPAWTPVRLMGICPEDGETEATLSSYPPRGAAGRAGLWGSSRSLPPRSAAHDSASPGSTLPGEAFFQAWLSPQTPFNVCPALGQRGLIQPQPHQGPCTGKAGEGRGPGEHFVYGVSHASLEGQEEAEPRKETGTAHVKRWPTSLSTRMFKSNRRTGRGLRAP